MSCREQQEKRVDHSPQRSLLVRVLFVDPVWCVEYNLLNYIQLASVCCPMNVNLRGLFSCRLSTSLLQQHAHTAVHGITAGLSVIHSITAYAQSTACSQPTSVAA